MRNLPDDWDGVTGDLQQMPTVGICARCEFGIVGHAEYIDGLPYHEDCYWAQMAENEEGPDDG